MIEAPEPHTYQEDISVAAAGAALLRGRWTLLAFVFLGGLFGVLWARITPPSFKSSATFMSQGTGSQVQGLAGLAGQFGFAIPGGGGTESPEFYQALLTSPDILTSVLGRDYSDSDEDGQLVEKPLLDWIQADGANHAQRIANGIEWLKGSIASSVNRQTGVVSLAVTTGWPGISQQVASALLDELQNFNARTRRTQAAAERAFLEERVAATGAELDEAEQGLQSFLQQNRQFNNSTELQFQSDRLQRAVVMREQVYTGLVEAFEQAKIREVRDTPVLTTLQDPIVPPFREARRTVYKGLVGMILGGGLAVVLLSLRAHASSREDPDVRSLQREWEATKSDIMRLLPRRRRA